MKVHVEMDHSAKFDAFMHRSRKGPLDKVHTNVSCLDSVPKIFHFCIMASCLSDAKFANIASVNEIIAEKPLFFQCKHPCNI